MYASGDSTRPRNVAKKKETQSFTSYARSAFENSLMTGVPKIARSSSGLLRFVKLLVFVVCFVGLLFQTTQFLLLYLSYPTVMDMQVVIPAKIEQPAVTVCNHNTRRRSSVCEIEGCNCAKMDKETMCRKYPQYCPVDEQLYLKVPDEATVYDEPCSRDIPDSEDVSMSHGLRMIESCYKYAAGNLFTQCEFTMRETIVREKSVPYEFNRCITIESQIEDPYATPTFYDTMYAMWITLDTESDDYLDPNAPPRLLVAIHDRKDFINPFERGFTLIGGWTYRASVSLTVKTSLPPPYQTNCRDYLEEWKKNSGEGPLTQKACIEHCKLKALKEEGKCIDDTVRYPHTEKVCGRRDIKITNATLERCSKSCGIPCMENTYEVKYEKGRRSECPFTDFGEWCQYRKILFDVIFEDYTLTTISYQPKYNSVELLSYVGGYCGVWIGVSLVSLFDLFGTLLHILLYPLRSLDSRKNASRGRRQRVAVY